MQFDIKKLVPDVYTSESRDFQLLGRLFDIALNATKSDIDSMTDVLDTMNCRSNMLSYLRQKLGFFSDTQYGDDILRYILTAFPRLIKEKGTIKCVKDAIFVYLKAHNIYARINNPVYNHLSNEIEVYLESSRLAEIDIIGLEDFLSYFIPSGSRIKFALVGVANDAETVSLYSIDNSKGAIVGNARDTVVVESVTTFVSGTTAVSLTPVVANSIRLLNANGEQVDNADGEHYATASNDGTITQTSFKSGKSASDVKKIAYRNDTYFSSMLSDNNIARIGLSAIGTDDNDGVTTENITQ